MCQLPSIIPYYLSLEWWIINIGTYFIKKLKLMSLLLCVYTVYIILLCFLL